LSCRYERGTACDTTGRDDEPGGGGDGDGEGTTSGGRDEARPRRSNACGGVASVGGVVSTTQPGSGTVVDKDLRVVGKERDEAADVPCERAKEVRSHPDFLTERRGYRRASEWAE
jgi:hypothetical protein